MSLSADAVNFSNLSINETLSINDKVYSTYSLEEVGASVANTSTINSLITPINNSISELNNYITDELKTFTPYYISKEVINNYYHFVNDLSYVTVPPYTTCMLQANLIFHYGYNIVEDPSAQSHNIFINYGCSNTLLTQAPYTNSGVDTADVFSNNNIIPYSFNQKILHYNKSVKYTPINHDFFYDNTTDTSQNIYLFASMQQYYNVKPTKIVGKLVYNFIKHNSGTNLFTYNSFSTTYKNLLTISYKGGYNTYNSTYLSTIDVPANSTALIYNAISFKLSELNAYNQYGTLYPLNYYFYCSYVNTPISNLEHYNPINGGSYVISPTTYVTSNIINQSLKVGQLLQNKVTSPVHIFDTNSFIYKNMNGTNVTLYLHFGIFYNTNLKPIYVANGQVTGTMGSYTLTNNNSTSNMVSNIGSVGSVYPNSVFASLNVYKKKRYLTHSWTHLAGNNSANGTTHFTTVNIYGTTNINYAANLFYPDTSVKSIEYIKDNPELYMYNTLNSVNYEGTSADAGGNAGITMSSLNVIDTMDVIYSNGNPPIGTSIGMLANFPVATVASYIIFEI
jgi:hypothetical protein